MSKKGVSKEEKKNRLLQLFFEKGECFQLKELERIAPKEKGIVANSVKEILQILVEEGSVDTDKIGTSVYFWAFPSKAMTAKKRALEDVQTKHEYSCKKLKLMEKSLEFSEKEADADVQRNKILEEIQDKELKLSELKSKLKQCKENDPEKFKLLTQQSEDIKTAANRWTDNIFAVKAWCKKKFLMEDQVLNKQFGIPEELDYID